MRDNNYKQKICHRSSFNEHLDARKTTPHAP